MATRRYGERIARLATRQFGRVTWAQLEALDVDSCVLQDWLRTGYATRVLPRVYALGHLAPSREADLWSAVLYAGPGAALSHATAAQWQGLIDHAPVEIEVSTPRKRVRSVPGRVRVYGSRERRRPRHRGVPTTTVPQTLLDLAAGGDETIVRRALAQLDYRKQLNVRELEAACGHGRAGSRLLRRALRIHQPALAYTNAELEAQFLKWCERWKVPIPRFNVSVHGVLVDAYWAEHGLVVEMDGDANHSSRAQRRRDREKELVLRAHDLVVLRYDWSLLHEQPAAMHADLMRHIAG